MPTKEFDIVVVGAGTAGAAAAYQFAIQGRRVALVEQRELGEAGARWINGVAPWMFDRAGLARPVAPELRGRDGAFLLYSSDGRHHVRVERSPVWQLDMRHLVARLQQLAVAAGVDVFPKYRAADFVFEGGRPTELVLRAQAGGISSERLGAKLFVDATGIVGALRRKVTGMAQVCVSPGNENVCSAAQEVRRIRSRAEARRWLEAHGAAPGDSVGYVGVDGGFSTLSVQIDFKHGEVDLLSGSTADGTHRSGPKLIADFVKREGWIGRKVFGGSGAIPLRRPYAAMVAPGIALVGDSACQVFPAHGSGIGTGLIAGRLLAEATAESADPGERSGLLRYQHAFMREVGAVSAAYDVIRQLSQRLSDEEAISLIASGLTTPALASATLAQEMASPSIGDLAGLLQGVRAAPKLAAKLAPAIVKMRAAHLLYRGFPENPDGLWATMWERLHAGLFPAPTPMAANEPEFESFREAA